MIYSFLQLIACCVLISIKGEMVDEKKMSVKEKHTQPLVDNKLQTIVQVHEGEIALLPCRVLNRRKHETISWIRHKDLHILTVNEDVYTTDKRFEIIHVNTIDWVLKIRNCQTTDSGVYECQVNGHSLKGVLIQLDIIEDNFDDTSMNYQAVQTEEIYNRDVANDNVFKLHQLSLDKDDEGTVIAEGVEKRVQEGNTIEITCEIRKLSHSIRINNGTHPTLLWFHNNKIISVNNSRDGTAVITRQYPIHSRLVITHATLNDSGNYTCWPLNYKEASIHVFVTNGHEMLRKTNILLPIFFSLFSIRLI